MKRFLIKSAVLTFLHLIIISCDDYNDPYSIDNGYALYVSVYGGQNNSALWILDPDNLELIDSLTTGQSTPQMMEFSPDYSKIYVILEGDYISQYQWTTTYLTEIDIPSMTITRSINTNSFARLFTADKNKQYLIVYDKGIQFYNRESLSLVHIDTTLDLIRNLAPSPKQDKVYFAYYHFNGIVVYNINSFQIDRVIPIADSARQYHMELSDIIISPDEKYAFITVFNWYGGDGYGSFFVVDLEKNRTIKEYNCGSYSQMAVSTNGRNVYVGDPAGYYYQAISTNKMWKYDISSKSYSTFVRNPQELGFEGILNTDNILLTPDNHNLFISCWDGKLRRGKKEIDLFKLNTYSKTVLATFSLPINGMGYTTHLIMKMKLGKYIK